jgi:hypothetical protein
VTASSLRFGKETLIQPFSEAVWYFEELVVAEQLNDISHTVVDGGAVIAARKVAFNLESQLRDEIALEVIRQLPEDLLAVDFYKAQLL